MSYTARLARGMVVVSLLTIGGAVITWMRGGDGREAIRLISIALLFLTVAMAMRPRTIKRPDGSDTQR